jgi:hypothetical protein
VPRGWYANLAIVCHVSTPRIFALAFITRHAYKLRMAENVPQLLDRLGGLTEVARLIRPDMPVTTVSGWKIRERIPIEHWDSVIAAAKLKGFSLTERDLKRLNTVPKTGKAA